MSYYSLTKVMLRFQVQMMGGLRMPSTRKGVFGVESWFGGGEMGQV